MVITNSKKNNRSCKKYSGCRFSLLISLAFLLCSNSLFPSSHISLHTCILSLFTHVSLSLSFTHVSLFTHVSFSLHTCISLSFHTCVSFSRHICISLHTCVSISLSSHMCLSLHNSLLFSSSLLLFSSLSLFSLPSLLNDHDNDHLLSRLSLCTHSLTYPECQNAQALAHSLVGELIASCRKNLYRCCVVCAVC